MTFWRYDLSNEGVLNSSNNEFNLALDTALFKGNVNLITFGTTTSICCDIFDDTVVSIESLTLFNHLSYCNEGLFNYSFAFQGQNNSLRKPHYSVHFYKQQKKGKHLIMHF
jgi:hypothetical protein